MLADLKVAVESLERIEARLGKLRDRKAEIEAEAFRVDQEIARLRIERKALADTVDDKAKAVKQERQQ